MSISTRFDGSFCPFDGGCGIPFVTGSIAMARRRVFPNRGDRVVDCWNAPTLELDTKRATEIENFIVTFVMRKKLVNKVSSVALKMDKG
jgi:hypothetical protein